MTPADVLAARTLDPFCANAVLATIDALADFSHSNAIGQLVTAGRYRSELLLTLGKVAPPRYANFIGRFKDDSHADVRRSVAAALGRIGNEAVAVPVLVQLLARGQAPDDFPVKWEAAVALTGYARKPAGAGTRRRLAALLTDPDAMTVALAARALALAGDPAGVPKLRDLTGHADAAVREEATLALGETRDGASGETVARRLQDESLAVRAAAVHALGRIAGPAAADRLRRAVDAALEYEKELERQRQRGESEETLRRRYGLGVYDLRETLQRATAAPAR